MKTLRTLTLALAPVLLATAARADVAGAMASAGSWLVGVIVAAAILLVIVACMMVASGGASLRGILLLIGGLAAATHPEEIAALITGN